MSNLNTVVLHDPLHSLHWELGESPGPEFIQGLNQGPRMGTTEKHFQSWGTVLGFFGYVGVHMSWTTLDTYLLFQTSSYNSTAFMFILCFFLDVQRHSAALTLSAVLHQLHQSKYSICSPLAWYRTITL